MGDMSERKRIEASLLKCHALAQEAYERKDLSAYRDMCLPDLEYVQKDGRTIGRAALMHDVAVQFRRLDKIQWTFTRESLDNIKDEVRETLLVTVSAEASAFRWVRRLWRVERRAVYTWRLVADEWKLARVVVLHESTTGRWKIGR
jgi:hypothetical protein